LKKNELIETLKSKGIAITNNQLRRYVQYGLIQSKHKGLGRGRTRIALHPDSSVQTIERILQGYNGNMSQDLIFILFWEGYPISYGIMIEKLMEEYHKLIETILAMDYINNDGELKEEFIQLELQSRKRIKRPGRPSNEDKDKKNQQQKRDIQQIELVFPLFSELKNTGSVSSSLLYMLLTSLGMNAFTCKESDLAPISELINIQKWNDILGHITEDDLMEIQLLIEKMKDYYSMIHAFKQNPVLINMLDPLKRTMGNFLSNPFILKMIVFSLIEPTWRNAFLHYLQEDSTLEEWRQICSGEEVIK
jgi:hypothetical protein